MSTTSGPHILETPRLLLRPRSDDEAEIYHRLWSERDRRVPAHRRIDADGRPTVTEVMDEVRAERDDPRRRLLAVVVKETGEVIGYCGLVTPDKAPEDEPTLAYELLQASHGHGFATEAARAVLTWSDQMGFRRLWADVWDWNFASRRVLDKVGFCETGRVVGESPHGKSLLYVRESPGG